MNVRMVTLCFLAVLLTPVTSVAAISSQVVCLNANTGSMVVKSKCSRKERALTLNSLIASAALKGPRGPQGPQGPQGASGDVAAILGPKSADDVVTISSLNAASTACVGMGGSVEGRFTVYTVPSNKTLIITEATVSGSGASNNAQIGESLGGATQWKLLGALFSANTNLWRYSSSVGVSFAPGSTVVVTCDDVNGGQTHYAWHLSGYLTD